MTRRPGARGDAAWRLAGLLVHELAQPAAAAMLAAEVAEAALARGQTEAAAARLAAVIAHLARLQSGLVGLGAAASAESGQPEEGAWAALAELVPGGVAGGPAPPVAGGAALAPALRCFARCLSADHASWRYRDGMVELVLSGPGRADRAAALWRAALHRVGVGVRWRRARGRTRLVVTCQAPG